MLLLMTKKNNYNYIFKQKIKENLKPKIYYKKYCKCCTLKKKIIIIRVEFVNFY